MHFFLKSYSLRTLDIPQLSTGDMLREAVAAGTEKVLQLIGGQWQLILGPQYVHQDDEL